MGLPLPRTVIRSLALGLFAAACGVVLAITPAGLWLEESAGLWTLFTLRGKVSPPGGLLIASIDRRTAERLGYNTDPVKWSRSVHAGMLRSVAPYSPSVTAFDMLFRDPRDSAGDAALAQAMTEAGSVVLCQKLEADSDEIVPAVTRYHQERLLPNVQAISEAARASAPFPLPKASKRVNYFWTFKEGVGDYPTLPVVTYQLHALEAINPLFALISRILPASSERLEEARALMQSRRLPEGMRIVREIFNENASLGELLVREVTRADGAYFPYQQRLLKGLIRVYGGSPRQYLNFYGPVRTVKTIPYDTLLQSPLDPSLAATLKHVILLVGLAETIPSEQRDAFYTVFSDNGLDMPGVEIAATAIANLLDGTGVTPPPFYLFLGLIAAWGGALSAICSSVRPTRMIMAAILLGLLYLYGVSALFNQNGSWLPLAIPLLVQLPVVVIAASIQYALETRRQQKEIRSLFMQYLPEQVVDDLTGAMNGVAVQNRDVYAVCLYTDIGNYTALSESLPPLELAARLNSYFGVLINQIKQHGGVVSNIVGDSLLAMWVTGKDDQTSRGAACDCALDIQRSLDELRAAETPHALPTRIGLHVGKIHLGQVGAAGHYEYRPVGDIVNTATRLEGLNKMVGTTILASSEVVVGLERLPTRYLGRFVFVGKGAALSIYALMHHETFPTDLDGCFREALAAYADRSFMEAEELFTRVLASVPEDGPSTFYLESCKEARENRPGEGWNGEIRLQSK
ncbi:MAG: adenylate/guanylate cyclase domain-containing protein [Desulfuromonadaceae bacterium]|nr:adenylate/guanylate cyclase domain-containing protein [Desulfuromonadaceae bacterium]MDD5104757.1 adenylate/guanylate cyclase domain-containing protein [Desulfuromonadaceae bacterium]